jgi:hypothetical protein
MFSYQQILALLDSVREEPDQAQIARPISYFGVSSRRRLASKSRITILPHSMLERIQEVAERQDNARTTIFPFRFSRRPSILLLFHRGEQVRHGRVEGRRQLLHDQNRRHALTAFQEADVVTVQVGLGGEGFLRKAHSFAPPAKDDPELSLQRMHGKTHTGEKCQCNPEAGFLLHTIVCNTVVFET